MGVCVCVCVYAFVVSALFLWKHTLIDYRGDRVCKIQSSNGDILGARR